MIRSRALAVGLVAIGGASASVGAALLAPWLGLVVFGALAIVAGVLLVDVGPRR